MLSKAEYFIYLFSMHVDIKAQTTLKAFIKIKIMAPMYQIELNYICN